MKIPKKTRKLCLKCKKHTEHVVSVAKKRDRGALKKGSLARLWKRGSGKAGFGNKGKFSRKAISSWKRFNKKSSKKVDLRLKCLVCGKIQVKSSGSRAKKVVLE